MRVKPANVKYKSDKGVYWFKCPGCKQHHEIYTQGGEPRWTFNGDIDRPTFSPSLLVRWNYADEKFVCHSFIRNGQIQFLNDCTHALAGQTVDLPEME